MDTLWAEFFSEMEPDKRYMLYLKLKEAEAVHSVFLTELWEARYGHRKPSADRFIRFLMELKYLHESGSMDIFGRKKKLAERILSGLKLNGADRLKEEERKILFLELKNLCHRFMSVSRVGRSFQAAAFGMGAISDEGLIKKIGEQLGSIVFAAPRKIHMEQEFALLREAATEAFSENFPNRGHLLLR